MVVTMPPVSTHLSENIKLRLDTETLTALKALAAAGDRNVSQEIRRALRFHVENVEPGDENNRSIA